VKEEGCREHERYVGDIIVEKPLLESRGHVPERVTYSKFHQRGPLSKGDTKPVCPLDETMKKDANDTQM